MACRLAVAVDQQFRALAVSRLDRLAAVDDDGVATDEVRDIRTQPDDGRRDLLGYPSGVTGVLELCFS
jgi:hypothetical protein